MEKDYVEQDGFNEAEIEYGKVYEFPSQIAIHKHRDVFLAIYTEGVSWIVLENQSQLEVFEMLRSGKSVSDALNAHDEDDVVNVLVQIEAKKFFFPVLRERTEKNMYILLTNRCNQRCRHCYMYAGDQEYPELTVDQWIDVLDDFKSCGGSGVTFTGGEITVYAGFKQIIRHAHNIGLSVTVLSNGVLWTRDDTMDLSNYIDEIQISVDGYDTESYFSVRRYDGFDKALDCIRRFRETGTKVSMAVTPLLEDIDAFIEGFEGFAKEFISEYPDIFVKLNLELIQGREVHISPEENREYKRKLKLLTERLYPEYYTETFALNYDDHAIRRNCGFGEISIAPNGDVFWCNRIPELKSVANVLKEDFQTIVTMSEAIKRGTSVDNTKVCKECDVRYICGGGCRLEYEGIMESMTRSGDWTFQCHGKEDIYDKMILSNEYFFE